MLKLADLSTESSDTGAFYAYKNKGKVTLSESKRDFRSNNRQKLYVPTVKTSIRANHREEDC